MILARSAAAGSCVTMRIVLEVGVELLEQTEDLVGAFRSRSPVGSSATMIVGSLTMARAMATRCS